MSPPDHVWVFRINITIIHVFFNVCVCECLCVCVLALGFGGCLHFSAAHYIKSARSCWCIIKTDDSKRNTRAPGNLKPRPQQRAHGYKEPPNWGFLFSFYSGLLRDDGHKQMHSTGHTIHTQAESARKRSCILFIYLIQNEFELITDLFVCFVFSDVFWNIEDYKWNHTQEVMSLFLIFQGAGPTLGVTAVIGRLVRLDWSLLLKRTGCFDY